VSQPRTLPSLSLYRGQSRRGIGEGPGRPILQGEQYLAADGELGQNGALLANLVPWMTLDSDPMDHRRLGEQLEGWSCLAQNDFLFVVRLVSAGTFDSRAAYFAHARAWPLRELDWSGDPGALLGRSAAFEGPWQDGIPGHRSPAPTPAVPRPEQVLAEAAVAETLLAHLYQACLDSRPVIVAVPLEHFCPDSPLAALASFARAALPGPLKVGARLRLYSRFPEVFLRQPGAHLLAVPEETASEALRSHPQAVLLDRDGRRHAGPQPGNAIRHYAALMVRLLDRGSAGVLPTSAAFTPGRDRLPTAGALAALPARYLLGQARSLGEEGLLRFLEKDLPLLAREASSQPLPWGEILRPEEIAALPDRILGRLLILLPELPELAAGTWLGPAVAEALRREMPATGWAGTILGSAHLSRPLDTGLLLRLAAALPRQGRDSEKALTALYATLDERVMAAPEATAEVLAATGWWPFWRLATGLAALGSGGKGLRRTALAWLGAPTWRQEEAPEVPYETWARALEDLGEEGLDEREMARLCAGGSVRWPWISPFEEDQLLDLAGRARDENAQSALATALAEARTLPPVLGPKRVARLVRRFPAVGGTAAGSFLRHLERIPPGWPRPVERSPVDEHGQVDGGSRRPPRSPSWDEMWQTANQEHRKAFEALISDRGDVRGTTAMAHLATRPEQLGTLASWLRKVMPALPEERRRLLIRHGWENFLAAARLHPPLLSEAESGRAMSLGAMELGAVLAPEQGPGLLALRILHHDAAPLYRGRASWWRALLLGLRLEFARSGLGRGREDVARALLWSRRLLLSPPEQQAAREAFHEEIRASQGEAMDSPITFFGTRTQIAQQLKQIDAIGPDRPHRILLFAQVPFHDTSRESQRFDENEQITPWFHDRIRELMRRGGGTFAHLTPDGRGGWTVGVERGPFEGYRPAHRALLLRAEGSPVEISLDGSLHRLEPGQHLLVPVDEEAQRRLLNLAENLRDLGEDLETLIFDTLRRPSLDYRLSLLEEQRQPEPAPARWWPRWMPRLPFLEWLRGWGQAPVSRGFLLGLLLVGLLAFAGKGLVMGLLSDAGGAGGASRTSPVETSPVAPQPIDPAPSGGENGELKPDPVGTEKTGPDGQGEDQGTGTEGQHETSKETQDPPPGGSTP